MAKGEVYWVGIMELFLPGGFLYRVYRSWDERHGVYDVRCSFCWGRAARLLQDQHSELQPGALSVPGLRQQRKTVRLSLGSGTKSQRMIGNRKPPGVWGRLQLRLQVLSDTSKSFSK